MNIAPESSIAEITQLLSACGLPVEDIAASRVQFFGIRVEGVLVAVVGLELYTPAGLLRSLAVAPAYRGHHFGQALVAYAESFARTCGVKELFLLTTSAERFFLNLGYSPASRSAAPAAIQAMPQFSGLCPASSVFLSKQVSAAS